MPGMGWAGRLGDTGAGHRLPHARTLGLAPVAKWQSLHRWQRAGACLIARFGTLGRVPASFLLRSDNGLVFASRSYGLRQEFITPHCPQQNGMVERVIRTLKEQCVHRHSFKTIQHAAARSATGFAFTTTGDHTRRFV